MELGSHRSLGGATPHGGVEPSVGPKTVVVGFPRVVVVCLLALAELARRKAAAVEGMTVDKVGKAEAGKPPRALHADRPAAYIMVCYLVLSIFSSERGDLP